MLKDIVYKSQFNDLEDMESPIIDLEVAAIDHPGGTVFKAKIYFLGSGVSGTIEAGDPTEVSALDSLRGW